MKHLLFAAAAIVSALVLPGCLQNETTIHLNKDGTGTIVERTTFGPQMQAMMQQMASIGGGDDSKDPLAEMFSPEKGKAKAASFGEGVTFAKSVPLEDGANKGATTTWNFADINKLKIAPSDDLKNLSPMAAHAPPTPAAKPITFSYTGGTLAIVMPEPEKPDPGAPKPEVPEMEANPQMEEMMKQMMGDMKIAFKVTVEPGIEETDASFRDGNTVTLVSMDMSKVLEKPDAMKKLTSAPKDDPAAAMELFKGLDGVKSEAKQKITLKVK